MSTKCPLCRNEIPADDVNVGTDVAFCRSCNQTYKLSTLQDAAALAAVNLDVPPAGCWVRDDGDGVLIGASTRSVSSFFGLAFFAAFWNSIVGVFVAVTLASTLYHLGVTLPTWVPTPNQGGMPLGTGMTAFMWLFLTPFILIGLGILAAALMALAGRCEVRISRGEVRVFTGIGRLGWTRRINESDVRDVRYENFDWRDSDGDRRTRRNVLIETTEKTVKVGAGMPEGRMKFMAAALRRALVS